MADDPKDTVQTLHKAIDKLANRQEDSIDFFKDMVKAAQDYKIELDTISDKFGKTNMRMMEMERHENDIVEKIKQRIKLQTHEDKTSISLKNEILDLERQIQELQITPVTYENWLDVNDKLLQMDFEKFEIQEKLNKHYAAIPDLIKEIEAEIQGAVDYTKDWGNKLKAVYGDMHKSISQKLFSLTGISERHFKVLTRGFGKFGSFGIGVLAAIAIYGIKTFLKFDEALFSLRKNFGLLRGQNDEISETAQQIAQQYASVGVTIEQAVSATTELGKSFGLSSSVSKEIITNVAAFSAALGLSEKSSAGFLKNISALSGKTVKEASVGMMGFAQGMSAAAGTDLNEVMADIANLSESVRSTFKGNTTELIKTTIEARRLGISIDSMAKTSENLLDFNQSVNSEMEASVLLGRNINLMEARRLSFAGDIAGANKEILRVVKDVGDFDKLNMFQKKALATATGKTLEELQTMMQREKEIAWVRASGTDEQKKLLAEYEKFKNAQGQVAKNLGKDLESRIKSENHQTRMNALASRFNQIMMDLSKIVLPIVNYTLLGVEAVLKVINKISEALELNFEGMSEETKKTANEVKHVLIGVLGIWATIKLISKSKGLLSGSGKIKLDPLPGALKLDPLPGAAPIPTTGASGMFGEKFIKSINAIQPKNILAVAAAFVMLSAGMFVLAKAGKEFNNVDWNSLVKMGSIFAVFGLTVRFGSKMFAAASKDLLQFIAAFDLLALGMLGFSMSSRHMTDGIKDLSNIKNLSELALDIGLLGAALATFGITASTGGLINLFGGSGLVNKLITLSSLGGGLEKTARALTSINTSLAGINNNLNNGTFKEGISELVKSLTELNGEVDKTNFKKLQTISSLINTQSGNEEKTNPICKKLDELISLMKAGGIAVNIDGRKMSNALANASN